MKSEQNIELERKTRKSKAEKKALNNNQQSATATESPRHKSTAMDETDRIEAREFMKRQREKRKLTTKKETDKTFVIKQRLEELRKTTKNVIANPKKPTSQAVKFSPKDFYSVNSIHMKEIKVLKLKPQSSAKSQASLTKLEMPVEKITEDQRPVAISPVKKATGISSPFLQLSPRKPSASPLKVPVLKVNKANLQALSIPENVHQLRIADVSRNQTRQSSSKENKNPLDIKLKVPDVKLSMSSLNRIELPPTAFQQKLPMWLQNSAIQPYPYNFIFAVRKKLEAYASANETKPIVQQKIKAKSSFDTPHLSKVGQVKKGRNFMREMQEDNTESELKHSTMTESPERVVNSVEREPMSEANTISEISSIQSDLAQVLEKKSSHDDTSEIVSRSLKDEVFVGKTRESINSDYIRSSLEKKLVELNVSPNTTQKRINFLSSTLMQADRKEEKMNVANDLDKNKHDQEKEGEYQKMLSAFNQSLSNVIQVNQLLSTVLSSKSSQSSGTVNYTSSFENNPESEETLKASGEISEMIQNLVQQSQPVVAPPVEPQSESNSSIKTFIEDSKSTNLKSEKVDGDAIEDPPIVYSETAVQEVSSSSTKVTTTMIVQQKISIEKEENTLNESKLLSLFSEAEASFSIVDNNASFGMVSFRIN